MVSRSGKGRELKRGEKKSVGEFLRRARILQRRSDHIGTELHKSINFICWWGFFS